MREREALREEDTRGECPEDERFFDEEERAEFETAEEYINSAPTGGERIARQAETVGKTFKRWLTAPKGKSPLDLFFGGNDDE